jgi:hypothetical protein
MSREMSQKVWDRWQSNLHWVIERILLKGGKVREPEILPPIPVSEVDEFETVTGLCLPKDFADMVVNFGGGFGVAWSLYNVYDQNRDVLIRASARGGNWEVPFIGATERTSLLDLYHKFQHDFHTVCSWIFSRDFDDDEDTQECRRVIPHCFPLYLDGGGGGDYTVLRIDTDPAQILHLDHEWCFCVRGRAVLGSGYADYVTRWSTLGYPEVNGYSDFYSEEIRTLDVAGKTAKFWMQWLNT